jgi:membrane protein insertase Oxa1/YidC/SpoIIIJ
MWNFLFSELIYNPQLNLIQFLFNLTSDMGWAMLIVAILFNLLAFRWFTKSFLNMQKRLALTQDIKNIQHYFKEKNKIITDKIGELSKNSAANELEINELRSKQSSGLFDQQKLMGELNKKFNIQGNYSIKTILLQLWISIGLFTIFKDLVEKKGALTGLYPALWNGQTTTVFGENIKAFGKITLADSLSKAGLMWLPIVNALFTVLAMYYTFKYTQKPKVRETTEFEVSQMDKIKLQNEKDGVPDLDPEKISRQSQLVNMFLVPAMTFSFNYALPSGLNLYYALLSILYFLRTISADWFYRNHQYQYMLDVVEAGPVFPYEDHINELNKGNFDLRGTPTEIMNTRKN